MNEWWEKLKECYTKWVIFANLNMNSDFQKEAWKYFLVNWHERGMVERMQTAQREAKLLIPNPLKMTVYSPTIRNGVNRESIKREVRAICKIWNVPSNSSSDDLDKIRKTGCLGALDGTYINLMVSNIDKPRYQTRKAQISTNTLAVCDRNKKFVYVLPGWEGSTTDSRILRDALQRANGLRVPKVSNACNYYLCNNGYANSKGFLAPYKRIRYHLKKWRPNATRPQNAMELFNLRHSKACNVIERAFRIMKMRWGILRSSTFYPFKTQIRLIMSCFILNNFIRFEMSDDPIEQEFDNATANDQAELKPDGDFINSIESSPQWNAERDALAQAMWLNYMNNI
ncbi:uncharacterized protein LOC130990791 [Salvia miltiorrhiza]|uniref:uncharacterized protein LOC130990791 n=1 Tax=Salvia miltiorrhiza TaxID=226208 RepID=UPI0025AC2539|nr:uncharacterized protein LOC130990791 [Salvia miltiorrhiza]